MSIVQTGLLRKLYELAQDETEYKTSEFWQNYLRQAFDDTRTYSVTMPVTISALVWVECKSPSGDRIVTMQDGSEKLRGPASHLISFPCANVVRLALEPTPDAR
ncbi:hypothetical protein QBC46DRAFT_449625 [Diplogelasinospora grovesii]|uniref:Uncharacterized protein n=1 Tax=Diplogelasinospora grovesii TaxID=303347 RepID=A0AAN6S563_9PEZI|nr:hypothetical protein QBC46DRAFT_449625 [Diplogelasinospora grovesii]